LANPELSQKAQKENNSGLPLSLDHFSKKIYASNFSDQPAIINRLPSVFYNGFTFVSQDIANLIAQNKAGNCKTFPVEVYQRNRKTKVPGIFHTLNFGNTKSCFVLEGSRKTRTSPYAPGSWYAVDMGLEDDDIRVSSNAVIGPEIWIDPLMPKVFFLAGGLADELIAQGFKSDFALRRCKIV
jgi:hypothetical protein